MSEKGIFVDDGRIENDVAELKVISELHEIE